MKKAVVTGGAGFIGSHVVDGLIASGASVLVIDDLSSGSHLNLAGAKRHGGDRLKVLESDIRSDKVLAAICDFGPTEVFHLAAQMNVRRSVQDPAFDADVNVRGTVNLLEAARESKVSTFLFASTGGAIYGEQEKFPADENHRTCAEAPYGVSKRAGELYLEYYARTAPMHVVALRYANVYGPRQNPKGEAGVVAIFINRLLAGSPLTVNGDGGQTRDFVYVGDVVQANLGIAAHAERSQQSGGFSVYNVGTGIESSINDLVRVLKKSWQELAPEEFRSKEVVVTSGPALPGEQRRSVINALKLAGAIGWRPEVDFESGIRLTLESFIKGTQ